LGRAKSSAFFAVRVGVAGAGCTIRPLRDNFGHERQLGQTDAKLPLMAICELLCLDCGATFEVDSTKPIEGARIRCSSCRSAHVRQTFESYLRQAKAAWSPRRLDELRCNHFG
jgi:hypothetical protein